MIQLPTHAYLPGINHRHPDDAFDDVKSSVCAGQTIQQLAQSVAFQAGLHFLHTGFYWEAHEVLEPVWMELPGNSKEKRFVQALIQLANGRLKLHMGRPKAALRLVEKARELMPAEGSQTVMRLEVLVVQGWIDDLEKQVKLVL